MKLNSQSGNAFQFETMEKGKSFPVHGSFMEAWEDMFQYVNAKLKAGEIIDWQLLETAMWIKSTISSTTIPIYFCDARDKAIDQFKWVKPN